MRPTITRLATLVALLLLAAPLAAQAQQAGKVYNIGYLGLGSSFAGPNRTAFNRGLQEHGWIDRLMNRRASSDRVARAVARPNLAVERTGGSRDLAAHRTSRPHMEPTCAMR